jgi:beta-glucosidase
MVFVSQVSAEEKDRTSLDFNSEEDQKIASFVQELNKTKKIITVMMAPGAVLTDFWTKHSDAILVSFFGGEQFAPAIFNIMDGHINPSGKLPITFPNSINDANMNET